MLLILTHGHMPDNNILVASLGLEHISWLKDSKKKLLDTYSEVSDTLYMCPSPGICLLPKTNIPEVMNRNTVFREKDTDLKGKYLPCS